MTPTPALPLRVIAIGDSSIYGYGDPEGGGWVERLRRHCMATGPQAPVVYNLGVRGDGVRQVSRRLGNEFACRGELRNRQPDRLLISVGINDSPRVGKPEGRNLLPYDDFCLEFASLLEKARSLAPTLCIGMVPVNEAAMPFAEVLWYDREEQRRYRTASRDICDRFGLPYLDLLALWESRGSAWWHARLSADGLHPNPQGYRDLFADILAWEPLQRSLGLEVQSS